MGFLIRCPICGGDFKDGREYTGTSGVTFAPQNPLYEYCDAGLHFDCLEKWEHRKEFSEGYFRLKRNNYLSMGTLLAEGDDWVFGCGPAPIDKTPYYAEIDLKYWPCRLYSNWEDWNNFIDGGYCDGIIGEALIEAKRISAVVKRLAPDIEALSKIRLATLEKRRA